VNPAIVRQRALAAGLVALLLGGPATCTRAEERPDTAPSPTARQQALFERLHVAEAWKVTRGDPKVLVGVLDNGFDFFHPDLKGQLLPGYHYPGGYHTEFFENLAHGTMVASLIVARGDKGAGMSGLAPRCKVLTSSQGMIEHTLSKRQQQFFRDNPKASLADFQKEMLKHLGKLTKFGTDWTTYQHANAADAVRYLVDHGVRVINISGGLAKHLCPSAEAWRKLEDAFAYAARKDVVIVLAAGNNAAAWDDYPGSPDTVLVVGATRRDAGFEWHLAKPFEVAELEQVLAARAIE
jgi:subtilisin family serine protease